MRTVSFSSEPVRQILNEEFVCQLINTTGDPSAGKSISHRPDDAPGPCTTGVGKQNVQCLFMTPEGKIFHTASGFRGPTELLKELKFALSTYEAIRKTPARGEEIVRDLHLQRLRRMGFSDRVIDAPPDAAFGAELLATFQGFLGGNRGRRRAPFDPRNLVKQANSITSRGSDLADGRFAIQYPLMPIGELLKDPRKLVGREATAFASSGAKGTAAKVGAKQVKR